MPLKKKTDASHTNVLLFRGLFAALGSDLQACRDMGIRGFCNAGAFIGSFTWKVLYLRTAAGILLLAATFKVIALVQGEPFLYRPDVVITFLRGYHLLVVVSILEVVIGALVLCSSKISIKEKLLMVFWLALIMTVYRVGLAASDQRTPCRCFGSLFGWFGLGAESSNTITLALLMFLLLPSFATFVFGFRSHTKFLRKSTIILVTILCINSMASERNGTNVRLHGNTTLTGYDAQGHVFATVTDRFTMDMDREGKWLLNSRSSMNTNGYFEAGFDNRDVFFVQYSNRSLRSKESAELTDSVPLEQGRHLATISAGVYPYDLFPILRFTWFALASGFRPGHAEDCSFPAPWLDARTDLLAYAFHPKLLEPLPTAQHQGVKFLMQAKIPEEHATLSVPSDAPAYKRRIAQQDKIKALEPGTIGAKYEVLDSTNYLGMSIPTKYMLEVFWPGVGVGGRFAGVAQRFEGQVTAVEPLEYQVEGRPKPVGAITVRDFRFVYSDKRTAVPELRYKIVDGKWKGTNDADLQKGFSLTKQHSKRFQPRPPPPIRGVVLFLLGLLVVAPGIWLYARLK